MRSFFVDLSLLEGDFEAATLSSASLPPTVKVSLSAAGLRFSVALYRTFRARRRALNFRRR